jgi:hypothetical protein
MMWMRVSAELEDGSKARPNNYHRGLMLLFFDASRLAEGNATTTGRAGDLMARLFSS